MKRLILVRHGETEWNARHVLQGQEDIALSARGRQQVAAVVPLVRDLAPDKAVASDLKRASETAAILGFGDATLTSAWREAHLGTWEGRSKLDLDRTQYQAWRDSRFDPPGAESWAEFRARIADAVQNLPCDGTTIVVTHGGAIRAALSVLIDLDPSRIIPVDPGSVTVLDLNGSARLKAFNLTGDLSLVDPPD